MKASKNLPNSLNWSRVRCVQTGLVYASTNHAQRELNLERGVVAYALKRGQPTASGLAFERVTPETPVTAANAPKPQATPFLSPVRCVNTGIVYASSADAAAATGIRADWIRAVVNVPARTTENLRWESVDEATPISDASRCSPHVYAGRVPERRRKVSIKGNRRIRPIVVVPKTVLESVHSTQMIAVRREDTGETFPSVKAAARAVGRADQNVRRAAETGGTCVGTRWTFVIPPTVPAHVRARRDRAEAKPFLAVPLVQVNGDRYDDGISERSPSKTRVGEPGRNHGRRRELENIDTGIRYATAMAAAEAIGVDHSAISRAARGEQALGGGFRWRYTGVDSGHAITDFNRPKPIRRIDTGQWFASAMDAARSVATIAPEKTIRAKASAITYACERRVAVFGGIWADANENVSIDDYRDADRKRNKGRILRDVGADEIASLTNRYLSLLPSLAHRVVRMYGGPKPFIRELDDIEQDGWFGLLLAAQLYQPGNPLGFRVFAYRKIRSAMQAGIIARDAQRRNAKVAGIEFPNPVSLDEPRGPDDFALMALVSDDANGTESDLVDARMLINRLAADPRALKLAVEAAERSGMSRPDISEAFGLRRNRGLSELFERKIFAS